jgi:hypothetical protein
MHDFAFTANHNHQTLRLVQVSGMMAAEISTEIP